MKGYCIQFYYATTISSHANLQIRRQYENGTMSNVWALQYSDLLTDNSGSGVSKWFYAQVFFQPIISVSAVVIEGKMFTLNWMVVSFSVCTFICSMTSLKQLLYLLHKNFEGIFTMIRGQYKVKKSRSDKAIKIKIKKNGFNN